MLIHLCRRLKPCGRSLGFHVNRQQQQTAENRYTFLEGWMDGWMGRWVGGWARELCSRPELHGLCDVNHSKFRLVSSPALGRQPHVYSVYFLEMSLEITVN